jgi:NAD(P)-dependent dehydrogenase (short-subunit alcohol dehydrogenase family)
MATVLITGTSSGIGLETALALGRAGHKVHATMRDPGRAPELARAVQREGLPVSIRVMDVDSDASVSSAVPAIQAAGEPIDILVNNAGVERSGAVEELGLGEFRAVMETNYFGALRCIQAVVPEMRKRRSGCVINVTSIAGRISSSPLAAYSASKWALEALSEALAQEMKSHNVRVLVVQPGIIDTAMARRIGEQPADTHYPQRSRFAAMFKASLENPVPPSLVAAKIREVAESGTWQFRHPVGPDAEPFLAWRRSMSDEEWVELNAASDETFFGRLKRDFGLAAGGQTSAN